MFPSHTRWRLAWEHRGCETRADQGRRYRRIVCKGWAPHPPDKRVRRGSPGGSLHNSPVGPGRSRSLPWWKCPSRSFNVRVPSASVSVGAEKGAFLFCARAELPRGLSAPASQRYDEVVAAREAMYPCWIRDLPPGGQGYEGQRYCELWAGQVIKLSWSCRHQCFG